MYWITKRKFFKYFIKDKKTFFKYFFLSFVVGILELFGVALTYPFINRLLETPSDKIDYLSIILGIVIILAFISKNIFMIFYNSLQANFTKNCEIDVNKKFMNYIILENYHKTSKISLAQKHQIFDFLIPNSINNYLIRTLNLFVNIFIFGLISLFLFIKFFWATLITCICAIMLLILQNSFFKLKTKLIKNKINEASQNFIQARNEILLNTKNIKIFNREHEFLDKYSTNLETLGNINKQLFFYNSIPPYVTEPFVIIVLMILLVIVSLQNSSNTNTLVASYAVIVAAIFRLAPTISRIQVNLTGINTTMPVVKELIEYYEQFELDKGIVNHKISKLDFKTSIKLKDIKFSYTEENNILNGINLTIKKGEFISFVGSSGVGKTTLADIISGVLEFDSGEVYIDDIKTNVNRIKGLKIGYIPQDFNTISGSIRENVAFGDSQIDDNKVIDSLKKAQLYNHIQEAYTEGIYANPFVDSTGFSQGQKQRLAIARALYTDPDIIILDEATSSLDLKTEDEICEVLQTLKGTKTIIAIAHRLSTIKNSDKIVFLKNGIIADCGTYTELAMLNSDFRELLCLDKD